MFGNAMRNYDGQNQSDGDWQAGKIRDLPGVEIFSSIGFSLLVELKER